ncbi:MAG: HK97 family phage prohead protease [Fimbriimonadaceae bacterium]|nr:HK97 family phage prohead protease [Fimbriimonadaceae bacterium]
MSQQRGGRPVQPADLDGNRLRALISAESCDRDGELLLAAGCDLAAYRANPVVLWSHDPSIPPIGRAVEVWAEPGVGVWAINEFAATPFAQEIAQLYREGFLHAFSVGFRVLEAGRGTAQGQAVVRRWELLEQSAVAVPANPAALTVAAEAGNKAADWLLRTYYPAAATSDLARRLGLRADLPWPALASLCCRFYGFRGGLELDPAERPAAEALLRTAYDQAGRRFPQPRPGRRRPEFLEDEPVHFEEGCWTELTQRLRGTAEALRNLARRRRRRGLPLPELDPARAAAAALHELLDPPGAPSGAAAGDLERALAELRRDLTAWQAARAATVGAAVEALRRPGGRRQPHCGLL